jgi:riboflavin kinase/FMN adenylyltransferase
MPHGFVAFKDCDQRQQPHARRITVYAVRVEVLSGPQAGAYIGAASLGVRPMFGTNLPNLETFLFDFSGDLYGRHLRVALLDYLRPELKFDGLEALKAQIARDSAAAKGLLAARNFPAAPAPYVALE